uniref:SERTA domain-containing protein n=1 Tax=Oryzias melastigma TaxID=30732 RepID=A0A3B3E2J3_ORYME
MILKGQKRKLPQEDLEVADSGGPVWERQRQFVFSVSLNKYQRSQELPEPSLRRSVLIANTLRQMSLEGCREPPADMEVPETPPSAEQEYFPHESADSDVSLSAAISSILTALDSTIDGNSPRTPLRSLENLSGSSEVASVKLGVRGHGVSWQQADQRARDGGLSDVTVEDLFQDIDTCLLERDMGGLGLGGHQAGDDLLRYLPPFSLNPNLKCLPSFSSFSPLPAGFPPAAPSSMSAPSQSRETFELDNLMEILVES